MCNWITVAQALAPAISALVSVFALLATIWIARRQMRISHQQAEIAKNQAQVTSDKLRLDLYEKRLEAYAEFTSLFVESSMAIPDRDSLFRLESKIEKHKWLFGPEFAQKLKSVTDQAFKLRAVEMRLNRGAATENVDALLKRSEELRDWLTQQRQAIDQLFEPYLRIDKRMSLG